jgi:hypothetical protein
MLWSTNALSVTSTKLTVNVVDAFYGQQYSRRKKQAPAG